MEVKIMAEPSEKEEGKEKGYEDYELDCKARTLMEAEEIKADPKLMAALKPYLEKKAKAINSLADLRSKAKHFKEK
jgi:hypothetical protein